VDSWLVRSTPDRAVPVQALTGDILLCSWARPLDFKEHVKIICKSAFFRIRSIVKLGDTYPRVVPRLLFMLR